MAKTVAAVLSHWHTLIEGMPESPQHFYGLLDQAIGRRNISDLHLSRIDYREGGLLSAKREYFRVQRGARMFDICAAPFGTGFFISWWMSEAEGCLARIFGRIPLLGSLIDHLASPRTFYQLDVILMFQDSVHTAVMETIDQLTEAKGLRALSESERKPILSGLLQGRLAK